MRLHGHKKEDEELDNFMNDAAKALILFSALAICRNTRALNYVKGKVQEDPETYKPSLKDCMDNSFIQCEDFKTIVSMAPAVAFVSHASHGEVKNLFLKFFPEAKKIRIGQTLKEFCREISQSPRGTFDFLNEAAIFLTQLMRSDGKEFPLAAKDELSMVAVSHMVKLVNKAPYTQPSVPPSIKKLAKKIASIPFIEAVSDDDFDDTANYIYNVMKLYSVTPAVLENTKITARRWEQLIAMLKDSDIIDEDSEPGSVKDYLFIARIAASLSEAFAKERANALELYIENEELKKKLADIAAVPKQETCSKDTEARLRDQIRELQTENDKLQVSVSDLQSEIQSTNEYIAQVEARDEQEETGTEETKDEVIESYPDGTILIGGHGRWQKFFHQKYPNVRIVDGNDRNFNKGMFSAQTPLVLVNTTHLSHACFNRFYPVVKQLGLEVKYIYASSIA